MRPSFRNFISLRSREFPVFFEPFFAFGLPDEATADLDIAPVDETLPDDAPASSRHLADPREHPVVIRDSTVLQHVKAAEIPVAAGLFGGEIGGAAKPRVGKGGEEVHPMPPTTNRCRRAPRRGSR